MAVDGGSHGKVSGGGDVGAAGAMGGGRGRSDAELPELWVLLGLIFGIHLGWYLVLPYWAVVITRWRGLSLAQAGAVLGTQSTAYLVASLAGGTVADRVGRRATVVLGLAVQTLGLVLLAILPHLSGLLPAATVTGLGSGIVGAPAKAGIAALTGPGQRGDAFSWRGVVANLGVTLGPLLGGLLVARPMLLFVAAAAWHGIMAAIMAVALPGGKAGDPTPLSALTSGARRPQVAPGVASGARAVKEAIVQELLPALRDRAFMAFSLLSMAIWALYSQLNLAVPVRAAAVLGGARAIGLLWSASALMVIALQVPLGRILQPVQPFYILAFGAALMGAGLGSFALAAGLGGLLLAVAVFTLGEMLIMPTVDAVVARMAPGRALGTSFGIAAFAYGLGGAAGNSAGGALLQRSDGGASPWLWLGFTAAGLALGLAAWRLGRWSGMRSALQPGAR